MRHLALLALMIGCGAEPSTDDAPPIDGGVEDGGREESCSVEVAEPAPPAEPAAVIWSCPAGWREADGCTPWPESGPLDCPPGEAHFPGTPGCAPIGTDCPSGQFGEVPVEYSAWDRIYVDAMAPPGGDGMTAETATSTLRFGLLAALSRTEPTVVLVAKGDYVTGALPVRADMAVVGACARDTIVRSSTTAVDPDGYFGGSLGLNASIENMTMRVDGYG